MTVSPHARDLLREYAGHKHDCNYLRELKALRTADSRVAPINHCSCGYDWKVLPFLSSSGRGTGSPEGEA